MNLKSIAKSAAKLAVGAALTTGFAAVAQAGWTLSSSTSITDGNWVLKVTASGTELSVTGVTSVDDATTLDLSVAVEGGYSIVSVSGLATATTKASLQNLILPETLRTIGKDAFSNCTSLKTVTPFLPASLTSLGATSFHGCPIETPLVLSNPALTSIPANGIYGVFKGGRFPSADLSQSGITLIGQSSFQNDMELSTLLLPETLTTIGAEAFSDCTALKTVTPFLPESLMSLGTTSFYNCPVETPLVLSNPALTSIPANNKYGVFKGGRFPSADLSRSGITLIGQSSFQGDAALTTLLLPGTLTTIGAEAFSDCTALKTVTPFLPTALTSLGKTSFYNCPIETPLVLSNPSLASIPANDSYGVFKSGRFPSADLSQSGITLIGKASFQGNTELKTVTLPETLTTIEADAFVDCTKLSDVCFLSDVPTFGNNSFLRTVCDYAGRFRYPALNTTWVGVGTGYEDWDSVAEANRQKYAAAFDDGTMPLGVATFGAGLKCLVPVATDIGDRVDVVVRGEPAEVGVPEPDYGTHEDVGQTIVGSVSQFGDDGQIWYESKGYRIDRSSAEGWVAGEEVLGERTVSQPVSEGGAYGLVWLWGPYGYRVAATGYRAEHGSVTQTPADYGDSFYEAGRDVTLTATPVAGVSVFDRWYGDVPADQAWNATITVKADKVRTLKPSFTVEWTYDSAAKTITDGGWTLNVSGTADALTVTGVKAAPDVAEMLDLRKAVTGGSIVAVGNSAFSGRSLEEVRLPETLTTIGKDAFSHCSALKTVTPFLPAALTSLGMAAFYGCPIETPLVLSNPSLTSLPEIQAYGVFANSRFPSADLSQSGITTIGQYSFSGNTALTMLSLPETLTTIGKDAFSYCSALKTVTPFLPASVTSLGAVAFYGCPIETPLVLSNPALTSIPGLQDFGVFNGGRFLSADLSRSGITTIGQSSFQYNTVLEGVKLPKTLTSIGRYVFWGDSSLLSVDFKSLPTFGDRTFYSTKGLPARFTYPAGDAGWAKFIATSTGRCAEALEVR